ncbi:dihydrofolate reductase family protein [Cohnella silvisoli]|uniref:Dihydrofolate reductase family protein n=1 Tax=Cohnella silvisoli TaxID=2873699 RepID=A0ABV1KZL4_9BACL|nr:dihydrofolate reductase family protein [Cohnella silvisoli]MCD9021879.1 dihydrofolate reductase family protein [Cohnella silvisoli]
MRKIVVSEFVSLDGVMEDPIWTIPFNTDEQNQHKFEELQSCDTLLLGRVTYQGFAAAWPKTGETNTVRNNIRDFSIPDGFADRMNNYPKYVASKTKTQQEMKWNSSLITGNIAEEVLKLKQQPGRNILALGSCELVNTLMQYDLVDEYRIMVFPVVLGSGKRLFNDNNDMKTLKHVNTKTFHSGVVELTYEPVKKD